MKTNAKKIYGLSGVLMILAVVALAYVKPVQTGMVTIAATQNEQAAASTPSEATETASAEREIRAILERYYEIAATGDREALKNFSREISAPEYLYSSELGVMDKQAAFRHFEAIDLRFVNPAFEDLTIQVHGADAAVAKYLDTSTVKTNGLKIIKPTRFTNVWVKQNGAWKITAEHSSLAAPRELLPRNRFADNLARK